MSRPIEPTDSVTDEDAETLLASLSGGASQEEMQRRTETAKQYLLNLESGKRIVLRSKKA